MAVGEASSNSQAAPLLEQFELDPEYHGVDFAHRRSDTMKHMGAVRAYWLGVVVCMGGFLFGYDSGIIGA